MQQNKCLSNLEIERVLKNEVPSAELDKIESHLEDCLFCVEKLEQASMTTADEKLRQQIRSDSSPMADTEAVSGKRTENSESVIGSTVVDDLPKIPGFEVVELIGRGGMGVVYRAIQKSLNREVAIKMITGGLLAGPEKIARFYREAEALAKIDHANVIKIFDVGECKGLPYISMELISGTSLREKLDGTPWSNEDVAAIGKIIARALHAVHDSQVVHRDIKPSNILLGTGNAVESFKALRLTDFGLAKSEVEKELTYSGQVFGTPAYISPEQASGNTELIGPATDVYSLGCVIYELLTGRPPLQAASVAETVRQISEVDPVAPVQINPGVAKELSVVCLKCLQKDVRRRYKSCQELFEDLERYQNGFPVLAKPVSAMEQTWKAARRRPALATGVVSTFLFTMFLLITWGIFTNRLADAKFLAEKNEGIAKMNAKAASISAAKAKENEEKANVAAKRAKEEADIAKANVEDALVMFDGTREILRLLMEQLTVVNTKVKEGGEFNIEEVLDFDSTQLQKQLKDEPFSGGRLHKFLGFTLYKNKLYKKAIEHLIVADDLLDLGASNKVAMAERFDLQYTLALAYSKVQRFDESLELLDNLLKPVWNKNYPEWKVPPAVKQQLQKSRDRIEQQSKSKTKKD